MFTLMSCCHALFDNTVVKTAAVMTIPCARSEVYSSCYLSRSTFWSGHTDWCCWTIPTNTGGNSSVARGSVRWRHLVQPIDGVNSEHTLVWWVPRTLSVKCEDTVLILSGAAKVRRYSSFIPLQYTHGDKSRHHVVQGNISLLCTIHSQYRRSWTYAVMDRAHLVYKRIYKVSILDLI